MGPIPFPLSFPPFDFCELNTTSNYLALVYLSSVFVFSTSTTLLKTILFKELQGTK